MEAEAPIFWALEVKTQLTGKESDAGKDWRQEGNEMVRRHHQLSGHEFEQMPGDIQGQKSLARCSPWGLKELDMT